MCINAARSRRLDRGGLSTVRAGPIIAQEQNCTSLVTVTLNVAPQGRFDHGQSGFPESTRAQTEHGRAENHSLSSGAALGRSLRCSWHLDHALRGPALTAGELRPVPRDNYVGPRRCAECHPGEFAAYSGSGHAKPLRPAARTTEAGGCRFDIPRP